MPEHLKGCDGSVEDHVIYDKEASGYRAAVFCRCKRLNRVGRKVHEKHALAEADALVLLADTMKRRVAAQKAVAWKLPLPERRPNARIVTSFPMRLNGRDIIVNADEDGQSFYGPTSERVDQAWLNWWRSICARVGHESRL